MLKLSKAKAATAADSAILPSAPALSLPPNKSAGRPKGGSLTRDSLAKIALKLVESSEPLSMAKIAGQAKVHPTALTHHFPDGLAGLNRAMAKVVLDSLYSPFYAGESGKDYIRRIFTKAIKFGRERPQAAIIAASVFGRTPLLHARLTETLLQALDHAGVSPNLRSKALASLLVGLTGLLATASSPLWSGRAAKWSSAALAEWRQLDGHDFPALRSIAAGAAPGVDDALPPISETGVNDAVDRILAGVLHHEGKPQPAAAP